MEHISNHLQKVQAQTNSLAPLKETSVLTPEEHKVIELKYSGKQFGVMSHPDLFTNAKAALLKIHVITGWTIPEKEFLNILIDQFVKTVQEKYSDMNAEEMEFAFRSKGTTIEDWGKSMNLNLLDKVLGPYLNERYRISEQERLIAYKKTQPPFSLDNINYRKLIEEDYQNYLSGMEFKVFPVHYYGQLVKDGFIIEETENYCILDMTDQQKDKLVAMVFERAKELNMQNLYA